MSAQLSWELVFAFLVLAEELRLSAGAERLGISRQTLVRRIRQLEDQLGEPLFIRTTRRVELTSAGLALREHASPIAEALGQLAEQVRRTQAGGRLSIGISTDLTIPVTAIARPGLPGERLRSLTDRLLSIAPGYG